MSKKLSVIVVSPLSLTVSLELKSKSDSHILTPICGNVPLNSQNSSEMQERDHELNRRGISFAVEYWTPANKSSSCLVGQIRFTRQDLSNKSFALHFQVYRDRGGDGLANDSKLSLKELMLEKPDCEVKKIKQGRIDGFYVKRKPTIVVWVGEEQAQLPLQERIYSIYRLFSICKTNLEKKIFQHLGQLLDRILPTLKQHMLSISKPIANRGLDRALEPARCWQELDEIASEQGTIFTETDDFGQRFVQCSKLIHKFLKNQAQKSIEEESQSFKKELFSLMQAEHLLDEGDVKNILVQNVAKLVVARRLYLEFKWKNKVETDEKVNNWCKYIIEMEKVNKIAMKGFTTEGSSKSGSGYEEGTDGLLILSVVNPTKTHPCKFQLEELRWFIDEYFELKTAQDKTYFKRMLGSDDCKTSDGKVVTSSLVLEVLLLNLILDDTSGLTKYSEEHTAYVLEDLLVDFISVLVDMSSSSFIKLAKTMLGSSEKKDGVMNKKTRRMGICFLDSMQSQPKWFQILVEHPQGLQVAAIVTQEVVYRLKIPDKEHEHVESLKEYQDLESKMLGLVSVLGNKEPVLKNLSEGVLSQLPLSNSDRDADIICYIYGGKSIKNDIRIEFFKKELLPSICKNPSSSYYKAFIRIVSGELELEVDVDGKPLDKFKLLNSIGDIDERGVMKGGEADRDLDYVKRYCSKYSAEGIFFRLAELLVKQSYFDGLQESKTESIPPLAIAKKMRAVVDFITNSGDLKAFGNNNIIIADLEILNQDSITHHLDKFRPQNSCLEIKTVLEPLWKEYTKSSQILRQSKLFLDEMKDSLKFYKFFEATLKSLDDIDNSKTNLSVQLFFNSPELKSAEAFTEEVMSILKRFLKFDYFKKLLSEKIGKSDTSIAFCKAVISAKEYLYRKLNSMADERSMKFQDLDDILFGKQSDTIEQLLSCCGLNKGQKEIILFDAEALRGLLVIMELLTSNSINGLFEWDSLKDKKNGQMLAHDLDAIREKVIAPNFKNKFLAKDLSQVDPKGFSSDPRFLKNLYPPFFSTLRSKHDLFEFLRSQSNKIFEQLNNECSVEHDELFRVLESIINQLGFINNRQNSGQQILESLFMISHEIQVELYKSLNNQKIDDVNKLKLLVNKLTGDLKSKIQILMESSAEFIEFNPNHDKFELGAQPFSNTKRDFDRFICKLGSPKPYKDACQEAYEKPMYSDIELKELFSSASIMNSWYEQKRSINGKPSDVEILIKNFCDLGAQLSKLVDTINELRKLGFINREFTEVFFRKISPKPVNEEVSHFVRARGGRQLIFFVNKNWSLNLKNIIRKTEKLPDELRIAIKEKFERHHSNPNHPNNLLTYFTGLRMFYLIETLKVPPEQRRNTIEGQNVISLLNEAKDRISFTVTELHSIEQIEEDLEDLQSAGGYDTGYFKELLDKVVASLNQSKLELTLTECNSTISLINKNRVTVLDVRKGNENRNAFDLLLKLFSDNDSQKLLLSDILACSEYTDQLEIDAFIVRCFKSKHKRVYVVLNPGQLVKSVRDHLHSEIEGIYQQDNAQATSSMLIINDMDSEDTFTNPSAYEHVKQAAIESFLNKMQQENYQQQYLDELEAVTVVTSSKASEGKTFYIHQQHQNAKAEPEGHQLELIELSLAGEINRKIIAERLATLSETIEKLDKGEEGKDIEETESPSRAQIDNQVPRKKFNLHIKIDYVDEFQLWASQIDWILFNLCFFHMHHTDSGLRSYKGRVRHIFIELGNSQVAVNDLWTTSLLKEWAKRPDTEFTLLKKMEPFAQSTIKLTLDPKSDEQIVANYLKQYKTFNFVTGPVKGCIKSEAESNSLFKEYYKFSSELKMTFGSFKHWLSIVAHLKRGLDDWYAANSERNSQSLSIFCELSLEILRSANELINLQDNSASESQDLVMQILDNPDQDNSVAREKLKEKVNTVWSVDRLFLPIISRNSFLPVYISNNSFSLESDHQLPPNFKLPQDQINVINSRLATKRVNSELGTRYLATRRDNSGTGMVNLSAIDAATHLENSYKLAVMLSDSADQESIDKLYHRIVTQTNEFSDLNSNDENGTNLNTQRKGFSITDEVFFKLVLMYFKAQIKAPIIIMGESGCGKTYLTKFLVESLLQDKLTMQTLHSGYSEKRLIIFIIYAIKQALGLTKTEEQEIKIQNCEEKSPRSRRLWVFFDEFNTTPSQSLIADTIIDRSCPKLGEMTVQEFNDTAKSLGIKDMSLAEAKEIQNRGIQPNMMFVVCCNPFRIKLKKPEETDIGLIPNEKSSILSHIVHPIQKRVLSQVWDFGQLRDEDEKEHIRNQVITQQFFLIERNRYSTWSLSPQWQAKKNQELSVLVHNCHKIVRDIEERSGVSLRDTNRVYIFFRWFSSQLNNFDHYFGTMTLQEKQTKGLPKLWMLASSQLRDIGAAVCTMLLCYGLRLNGQTGQHKLISCITSWANYVSKIKVITRKQIEMSLCDVAKIFLFNKKKNIRSDAALNKPLLENFIALLACYAEKVPMIIIGAPGTSKTLSTLLFLELLTTGTNREKTAKEAKGLDIDLLAEFPEPNSLYYSGSQTSTAEAVERVFTKAEQLHLDKKKNNRHHAQTQLIFFDELGLAELSPHNPLKVMHSHLEKNLGAIMFVGISNWKPDQSKLNRMICVARPDMSQEDILSVFNSALDVMIKDTGEDVAIKDAFRPYLESLSMAYLQLRDWQKESSKTNSIYHSNFHGSRDIYGAFNVFSEYIRTNWNMIRTNISEGMQTIIRSIERNLNGEIYIFRNPNFKGNLENPHALELKKLWNSIDGLEKFMESEIMSEKFIKEHQIVRLDDLEDLYRSSRLVFESREATICLSSSEIVKILMLNQLHSFKQINVGGHKMSIKDTTIWTLIEDNFMFKSGDTADEKQGFRNRFLMVRTESLIIEDIFINKLKEWLRKNRGPSEKEPKPVIEFRTPVEDSQVEERLNLVKTCISEGYTIVLKNQDNWQGALYELWNKKYSRSDEESCELYYGELKHRVKVHHDFRCVVILSAAMSDRVSKDLEKKQQAPFLNRFEKYYLHYESVFGPRVMDEMLKAREIGCKLSEGQKTNLVSLNIDMVTSIAVNDCGTAKEVPVTESDVKRKLLQLATINLLTMNLSYEDIKLLKEAKSDDGEELTLNSLLGVPSGDQRIKTILMTFTKYSEIKDIDSYKNSLANYSVLMVREINWKELRKNNEFSSQKSNMRQNLVFVFESQDDLEWLHHLRSIVDNSPDAENVLFFVQLLRNDMNHRLLSENNGINFMNGWDVRVIDLISHEFSYSTVIDIKDKKLLDAVLACDSGDTNLDKFGERFLKLIMTYMWEAIVSDVHQLMAKIPTIHTLPGVDIDIREMNSILARECSSEYPSKFLAVIKRSLKIYLETECNKGHSKPQLTVTDAVRASLRDLNNTNQYKDISMLLLEAVKEYFGYEIVKFFHRLEIASHGMYARILGLKQTDVSQEYRTFHLALVTEACEAASKDVEELELLECQDPRALYFYSPFNTADLKVMFELAPGSTKIDDWPWVQIKRHSLAIHLHELSRDKTKDYEDSQQRALKDLSEQTKQEEKEVIRMAEEVRVKLIGETNKNEISDDDPKPNLSFVEGFASSNSEEITAPEAFLIIDILRFVFCRSKDNIFGTQPRLSNFLDFLDLCNRSFGRNANSQVISSTFVRILAIALEVCFCFESVVRSLFKQVEKKHTIKKITKKVKEKLEKQRYFDTGERQLLVDYKVVNMLQMVISVKDIEVKVSENLPSLQSLSNSIRGANLFGEYRKIALTVLSMVDFVADKKTKEDSLNALQKLQMNIKELDQIISPLLEEGLKLFPKLIEAAKLNPGDLNDNKKILWRGELCRLVQEFLEDWTYHMMSFVLLRDPNNVKLYAYFTEEELILIVIGVSNTIGRILGPADSPSSIDSLLDKVMLRGAAGSTKTTEEDVMIVSRLIDYWASKEEPVFKLLLRAVHHNIIASATKGESKDRDQKFYSFDTFKNIVKTLAECFDSPEKKKVLQIIVASACFWICMSDRCFDNLVNHPDLSIINDTYVHLLDSSPENILKEFNSKVNSFTLIAILQKVWANDHTLVRAAMKSSYAKCIQEAIESAGIDPSEISVLNSECREEYHKMAGILEAAVVETEKDQGGVLLDLITKASKSESALYCIGLLVINKFLKSETSCRSDDEAEQAVYSAAFSRVLESVNSAEVLTVRLCMFVINLLSNIKNKRPDAFAPGETSALSILFKKLVAHHALYVLIFHKEGLQKNPINTSNWTEGIPTHDFCLKVSLDSKLSESCGALEEFLLQRLPKLRLGKEFWRTYHEKKKSMGLFRCTCGLLYNYSSNGYGETLKPCPYCKRQIGSMPHATRHDNFKQLELEDLPKVFKVLRQIYDETSKVYVGHTALGSNHALYKIMRIQDVELAELLKKSQEGNTYGPELMEECSRNIYLKHLMDHLYLLALPLLLSREENDQYREAAQKSLKNVEGMPLEVYLMMHIRNDLKNLIPSVQLTISEMLKFFVAFETHMVARILTRERLEVKTSLCFKKEIWDHPRELINETMISLNGKNSKSTADLFSTISKVRLQSSFMDSPHKEQIAILESLDPKGTYNIDAIMNVFKQKEDDYPPLLLKYIELEELLFLYPSMMSSMVNLLWHVNRVYTGRISLSEAENYKFMLDDESSKQFPPDRRLRSLYAQFRNVWAQVVTSKLPEKLPHIFERPYTSRQSFGFNSEMARLLDKDQVKLLDFILASSENPYKTRVGPFVSDLLSSLIENVHNAIVVEVNQLCVGSKEEGMQTKLESTRVFDLTKIQFVGLTKSLKSLVQNNSTFDPRQKSKGSFIIDIGKIQMLCSSEHHMPLISTEIPMKFEFTEGINKIHRKDIKNRFDLALRLPLNPDTRKTIESSKYDSEAEIQKLLRFMLRLSDYLNKSMNRADDHTETIDKVLDIADPDDDSKEVTYLKTEFGKLGNSDFMVGELSALYELVLQRRLEVFSKSFDMSIEQKLKAKITSAIKNEHSRQTMRRILEMMGRDIKEACDTSNDPLCDKKHCKIDWGMLNADGQDFMISQDLKTITEGLVLGNYNDLKEILKESCEKKS